jgi:predicted lipoprotein with Yx(FWY)xxD motif
MMMFRSTRTFLAGGAIVALAGLALAACGSSGGTSTAPPQPPSTSAGTPATPAPPATPAAPATVRVTSTTLGNILVDAQGRTLYLFQKDSGTTSTCTGACATFWPPLIAPGAPTSGSGANASLIGITKRPDGTSQVTYNGHPVYLFSGDQNPGDTNGQGVVAFGGSWFALSPSGNQVSSSSSNTGSGSGLGY